MLGLAVVLGGGCTFYTGQPQASRPAGAAGAPGSGGSGSTLPAGDAGDAGAGPVSEWVDATGSLTGRTHSQGVVFVTATPDSEAVIAGVGNDGLYSSTDGGATWQGLGQTGASDQITNRATSIVFDPDHPQTFWETGIDMGGGVYHSTDSGKTIAQLGSTDLVRQIDLVSVDFSDTKRRTLLAGGHGQPQTLFMSTDAGKTWTANDTIPDGYGASGFPLVLDSHTFLLGVTNAILRSTNAGQSWTTVSKAGGDGAPIQTPDGSIYWLIDGVPPPGMCSGVMRSDDQGLTWERAVGAGILNGELIALPDGSLASGTSTNVIVSRDKGATWTVVSTPLPFPPKGLSYSKALKAFFIWRDSPNETKVPAVSIARYDWDYETQ